MIKNSLPKNEFRHNILRIISVPSYPPGCLKDKITVFYRTVVNGRHSLPAFQASGLYTGQDQFKKVTICNYEILSVKDMQNG